MSKVKEYVHMVPRNVDGIQYTEDNINDIKEFLGIDEEHPSRFVKFENGKLYFRQNSNHEFFEVHIGDYITCDHEYFCYSIVPKDYFDKNYIEV